MAPLDSADGALRSMCRVVAKLLHPDPEKSEELQVEFSQKVLSESSDERSTGCSESSESHEQTEQTPLGAPKPAEPGGNSDLHQSPATNHVATDTAEAPRPRPAGPVPQDSPGGLSAWAKEEAVRYFREKLALDDKWSTTWSQARSELCVAHFRKLLDAWYPGKKDFWKQCQDFCKEWSGWQSGPPRCRPLSAGRLNNYLTHLHRGSTHRVEEIIPTPEILAAVQRYGIRVSDIRLTSQSIFDICKAWTGEDWRGGHAADPCPWPVPRAFDGLKCSWQLLAMPYGHNRVYLNPPWSQLDCWLEKAAVEYSMGLQILMVVPRWSEDSCISILTTVQKSLRIATPLRIKTRRLWDAEFTHPTSGSNMAPLDVTLIWML